LNPANVVNLVSIIQGRLSPPPQNRIQAFPWGRWELEFELAAKLGFDGIEWLFEEERHRENPITTAEGRTAIRRRIDQTGVKVFSVCADYFMVHPFFRVSDPDLRASIDMLCTLIEWAAEIGSKVILLPVLETSEVRNENEAKQLVNALARPLNVAGNCGIRVGLETELPADRYRALIEARSDPNLGIYFDVGNATYAGHNAAVQLNELAGYLVGVHVKDRKRGGSTVPLGEGDADFPAIFCALHRNNYRGHIVVQAASGADYIKHARRSLQFVRTHLCCSS
jgi:L-ribulose-5-phosphate 3-epimerase